MAVFYSPECTSTNKIAEDCANLYSVARPLAVYTFHQTQGRGQGNNTWVSEPGKNLALTVLQDISGENDLVIWNKAITLAVFHSLCSFIKSDIKIKWPNDIYVNNKKACGILFETNTSGSTTRHLSAGIGINVNQQLWPADIVATSITKEIGKEIPIIHVLKEVIENIGLYINKIKSKETYQIQEEYDQNLWNRGNVVVLESRDGEKHLGTLLSIDAVGRIVIETPEGPKAFHHGEARLQKSLAD